MRDNNYVVFPTEEERERSIHSIIEIGMPEKQSLSAALPKIFKSLGFRGLFFGVGECVFLAILASILLWAGLLAAISKNNLLYALFAASPFMYAALHFLTTWKEIMTGTYEIMMTCRCSRHQLTILRMLIFGGICVVASVLTGAIAGAISAGGFSIFRSMGVSFSALFLFATVQLLAEWKWHSPKCHLVAPVFWLLLCLALLFIGERSIDFIVNIPTIVFWIIAVISLFVYIITAKKYYFDQKEGALNYAVG